MENWTNIVVAEKVDDLVQMVRETLNPYGAAVVGSAILVRADLAPGDPPADAAKNRLGGLTGFQAGAVAAIVSSLSPRGEEFRRWWNRHVVIGSEGERANAREGTVLNPALLEITEKDVGEEPCG